MSDSLLQRIARGDQAAASELLDRYGPLVWSLARRAGLPRHECEDIVQEIFAELWSKAARFDPGVASETTFVAMVSRRRLIDRRRRLGAGPAMTAGATEADPGRASTTGPRAELDDAARLAVEALERLGDEQQKVLRLSMQGGLSHDLIAQATGLPLGTVKTHARRGLLRLRELLGAAGPQSPAHSQAHAQGGNG